MIRLLLALVLLTPTQDSAPKADPKAEMQKILDNVSAKSLPSDPDKAIERLDTAEKDLTDFVRRQAGTDVESEARYQLGLILSRRGKNAEAVAAFREAIATAKKPESKVAPLLLLAQAQQTSGDVAGAKETFRAFLKEFPSHEFAPSIRRRLKLFEAREKLVIGKPVPPFDKKSQSGGAFSTSALAGQVFLVDFGASWCKPWVQDQKTLANTYARHHARGFEVLGVMMDGPDEETFYHFAEKAKLPWPVFYDGRDWSNEIAELYGIEKIPASVLVDRKGIVRYLDLPRAALEAAVKALVAEGAQPEGKR